MKLILNNVAVSIFDNEEQIKNRILSMLQIDSKQLISYKILKKAIDARKKNRILFVYSFLVETNVDIDIEKNKNLSKPKYIEEMAIPALHSDKRPVIVGFGPCGMLCGLYLARAGLKPIIVERGKQVEDREKDIEQFRKYGVFNEKSNVCFGEGGAGTFSDGKLTTNVNDPRIRFVINEFIKHGAPKEIYYDAHPHIGSDNLRNVCKNIRNEIIELGGNVLFEHQFIDFSTNNNSVNSITVIDYKTNNKKIIETDDLILAIGHSARDTFKMLFEKKIEMKPKPFSIGVRVEIKQEEVNKSQYGKEYKNPKLKPAEFKIVQHLDNDRAIYSFCMCPGGEVVGSNTEENSIVTNGMSYFKRDMENANAALLVSVKVEDYYVDSPLDGMYFQEKIEKKAYNPKFPYKAPAQLVGDFIKNIPSKKIGTVKPTYLPGIYLTNLNELLPTFISDSLRKGIPLLSNKLNALKNYDNVLTGFETRSSSPIVIPRNEDNGYSSIDGIYPCGEGASYAGGIMSAAIDGLRICDFITSKYINK